MLRFKGRNALVTGGLAGIGKAIVSNLLEEGCRVVVFDVLENKGESNNQNNVLYLRVDISDESAVILGIEEASSFLGGSLNYLVNNAAVFKFGSVDTATSADWESVFSVNMFGTANVLRHCVPLLKSTSLASAGISMDSLTQKFTAASPAVPYSINTHCAIVNLSSISAFLGQAEMAPYAATKAALLQLSRSVALDLGTFGIRCNALCPGAIMTEASAKHAEKQGKSLEDTEKEMLGHPHVIIGRYGTVQEAARSALFLLSDDASYITGSALMCDGGWCSR